MASLSCKRDNPGRRAERTRGTGTQLHGAVDCRRGHDGDGTENMPGEDPRDMIE